MGMNMLSENDYTMCTNCKGIVFREEILYIEKRVNNFKGYIPKSKEQIETKRYCVNCGEEFPKE